MPIERGVGIDLTASQIFDGEAAINGDAGQQALGVAFPLSAENFVHIGLLLALGTLAEIRLISAFYPKHEPLVDADRAKELSIEISRKLVELAADGVTDPAQLRRLTLESLPLAPAH